MVKIIDGTNAVLGRLASYVAKEALKGEEIIVLNSEEVVITGSKKNITENFEEKRGKVGSSQKGPIHPRVSEKIVKRTIRGMLPNYREGRGRLAWKRIKCYSGEPEKIKNKEKIKLERNFGKHLKVGDLIKTK